MRERLQHYIQDFLSFSALETGELKMKFEPGTWHTIVWEVQGDEMLACVDDKEIAMAKADGMTLTRTRLQLVASGETAWFSAVKVWKAEPDPKWPKKKAVLQESLKK